jgi:hypothetical protein
VTPPLRDRRRATDAELAAAGDAMPDALVPVER